MDASDDAAEGATEAVHKAYQAYYRRLIGQVFALTADLTEAEDVVQEAFARVLARPRSFLAAEDPERWLRVTALNVARTRFRRRLIFTRLVRTGRVEAAAESVPGMSPDRLALLAALRRLGRPTREAVVLHYVADLPVEEVAATLGAPVGTVKARLARGRRALAKLLSEEEPGGVTPTHIEEAKHA